MRYQGLTVNILIFIPIAVTPVTSGDKAYCRHGDPGDDSDTPLKGCHMSPIPAIDQGLFLRVPPTWATGRGTLTAKENALQNYFYKGNQFGIF